MWQALVREDMGILDIGIEFRMQQNVDVEGAHQVSRSNAAIIELFVVMYDIRTYNKITRAQEILDYVLIIH